MPGLPFTQTTEIDFGPDALYAGSFTISDVNIKAGQLVRCEQSADAATGRSADENEMDQLLFATSSPVAGAFTVFVSGYRGPLAGKYKILYSYTSSTQI